MEATLHHKQIKPATAIGITILLTIIFSGLLRGAACAAELFDIVTARPCSAITGDRVGASGNCSASSDHKILSVNLTVRQLDLSAHPEDATLVTFDLPQGIAYPGSSARRIVVDGLMLYNDALAPEVWRLNAGSTLAVKLVNHLNPGVTAATNLHTHGLLVSPDLDTRGDKALEPVGDTVYVCTIPEGADPSSPSGQRCSTHGAFYGAKTSEMNYRLVLPADHPEGLFWYHPHVHMNARTQVGSGLSGLIFVKGTSRDVSGGARVNDGPDPTERFLMLKDHQIGSISAGDPSLLKAAFLPVEKHDAGLCGSSPGGPWRGVCFNGDQGWLFTVNGQLYPHITVKAGGREVWRIANTSADMSYDVALVALHSGRPLRMQLLARDGVAAAQEGPRAIMVERVLMMPSSRIEVAIDRNASDGLFDGGQPLEAVLKTYGHYTGGDSWPAVDLAGVTFEALPVAGEGRATPILAAQYQPMAVRPWMPAQALTKAPAGQRSGADPRTMLAPGTEAAHDIHGREPPNEHPMPLPTHQECKPLEPGEERVIALAIDDSGEVFKIGSSRAKREALTPAEWKAVVQKTIEATRPFGDAGSPLLCAHAGSTEVWNIVNERFAGNQENHNFHIHQTKFEVLAVQDPHGRIEPPRGGAAAERLVDNYPVPIDGLIRIRIRFNENQAGGRFVFLPHSRARGQRHDGRDRGAVEVAEPAPIFLTVDTRALMPYRRGGVRIEHDGGPLEPGGDLREHSSHLPAIEASLVAKPVIFPPGWLSRATTIDGAAPPDICHREPTGRR
jgi:FtsP/CotA-like multicopper oxidase with cupredoxin domain